MLLIDIHFIRFVSGSERGQGEVNILGSEGVEGEGDPLPCF